MKNIIKNISANWFSFFVLLSMLLFYPLIEMNSDANVFTLIILFVGFNFLYEAWYIRSVDYDLKGLNVDSQVDARSFMKIFVISNSGTRMLFFIINALVLIFNYRGIISENLIWFMILSYLLFGILHANIMQVIEYEKKYLPFLSVLCAFLGALITSSSLLQDVYYSSVGLKITGNLKLVNCIILLVIPLAVFISYLVFSEQQKHQRVREQKEVIKRNL
ncbi:MAG: hypothetical protein HKN22_02995 [Bacteroidia bacterium]|nr:hypothetical protein [Bacteroidia bacterium]